MEVYVKDNDLYYGFNFGSRVRSLRLHMSTLMLQRLEAAYTGNLKVNFPNQIVLLPEAEEMGIGS